MKSNIPKMLLIADQSGINSVKKLSVFLTHAENQGKSIAECIPYGKGDAEYRSHYTAVRSLMDGQRFRGYDGSKLLRFDRDEGPNKEYPVFLTRKGKSLYAKLQQYL